MLPNTLCIFYYVIVADFFPCVCFSILQYCNHIRHLKKTCNFKMEVLLPCCRRSLLLNFSMTAYSNKRMHRNSVTPSSALRKLDSSHVFTITNDSAVNKELHKVYQSLYEHIFFFFRIIYLG